MLTEKLSESSEVVRSDERWESRVSAEVSWALVTEQLRTSTSNTPMQAQVALLENRSVNTRRFSEAKLFEFCDRAVRTRRFLAPGIPQTWPVYQAVARNFMSRISRLASCLWLVCPKPGKTLSEGPERSEEGLEEFW